MSGRGHDVNVLADTDARSAVFMPGAVDALYSPDRRSHLAPGHPVVIPTPRGESRVVAVELLTHPQAVAGVWPAVAILHVESTAVSDADLLSHLGLLGRRSTGQESVMSALAGLDRDAIMPSRPPLVYTSTLFDHGLAASEPSQEHALLLAASLESSDARPASATDLSMAREFASRIPLSSDWEALVHFRGVGYVMTRDTPFRDSAFTYAETIYLDALALVLLHGHVVDLLSSEVTRVDPEDLETILALDRTTTEFRSRWWWPTRSTSTVINSMVDRLREALASNVALNELLLSTQLLRQSLETRLASKTEASERRSAAALGFLSIVGLPLGVALTIWQGFTPSLMSLGYALIGAAVPLVVMALVPRTRGIWQNLWRDLWQSEEIS